MEVKREELLLSPEDIKPSSRKFKVMGVLNPAAARAKNGDIVLYVRVIEKLIDDSDGPFYLSPRMSGKGKFQITLDKFRKRLTADKGDLDFSFPDGTKRLTFISHFRRVVLTKDGFKIKFVSPRPSFFGIKGETDFGVEDPRITRIGSKYYMTYVGLSRGGNVSTYLAESKDLIRWKRRGLIFREQNKDVVLFPNKVKGKYLAFNRPEGNFSFSEPHIWLAHSNNLEMWGDPEFLLLNKRKKTWDSGRVGAGPPPIRTKDGWLFIYHGVIEKHKLKSHLRKFMENVFHVDREDPGIRTIYCAGVALLDKNNPAKILKKARRPVIWPKKEYEKGTFEDKDVVFPTGIVPTSGGKDLLIYSGGGDINVTVRKVSLAQLERHLEKF